MTGNIGPLIVAVLDSCYRQFGAPTPETIGDHAAWVKWRVEQLRDGTAPKFEPLPRAGQRRAPMLRDDIDEAMPTLQDGDF